MGFVRVCSEVLALRSGNANGSTKFNGMQR